RRRTAPSRRRRRRSTRRRSRRPRHRPSRTTTGPRCRSAAFPYMPRPTSGPTTSSDGWVAWPPPHARARAPTKRLTSWHNARRDRRRAPGLADPGAAIARAGHRGAAVADEVPALHLTAERRRDRAGRRLRAADVGAARQIGRAARRAQRAPVAAAELAARALGVALEGRRAVAGRAAVARQRRPAGGARRARLRRRTGHAAAEVADRGRELALPV